MLMIYETCQNFYKTIHNLAQIIKKHKVSD